MQCPCTGPQKGWIKKGGTKRGGKKRGGTKKGAKKSRAVAVNEEGEGGEEKNEPGNDNGGVNGKW